MALPDTAVPLWRARVEDVLITGELRYRVPKSNAFTAKARAKERWLRELAGKTASTGEFLAVLARAAREVCRAGAAGVSILRESPPGSAFFHWEKVDGVLAGHAGGTSPRDWSPSGTTLECKSPQLFLYPARFFHYLNTMRPPIVEALVVPIYVAERPWGTLWATSHEEHRKFDQTDVDIMSSLAGLASSVLDRRAAAAS